MCHHPITPGWLPHTDDVETITPDMSETWGVKKQPDNGLLGPDGIWLSGLKWTLRSWVRILLKSSDCPTILPGLGVYPAPGRFVFINMGGCLFMFNSQNSTHVPMFLFLMQVWITQALPFAFTCFMKWPFEVDSTSWVWILLKSSDCPTILPGLGVYPGRFV